MCGYADAGYAESLAEFGVPRLLPRSRGWVLEREIAGTTRRDAMGCYPLFACREWSQLGADVEEAARAGGLVSLAVVPDPFGGFDAEDLRRWFPDVCVPFKEHFVNDLAAGALPSKHHRYYARKASEKVTVEACDDPSLYTDEWAGLYADLVERHGLRGIKAFSRRAFERQLKIPGLVMLRAVAGGAAVASHLWFVGEEVAYSHLAASCERGYELMAPYALYAAALELFRGRVRWLELGAGAGTGGADDGGLTRFKRGWATETRTAYFCGRIFDRAKYDEITRARRFLDDAGYFPAYRAGEMA